MRSTPKKAARPRLASNPATGGSERLRPLLAASPEGPDKNKQQIREDHKDYDASDDDKSDQDAPHDAFRTASTNSHETVT